MKKLTTILLFVISIVSCSPSIPTAKDVKQNLVKKIAETKSEQCISVSSVDKTDGYEGSNFGGAYYAVEYEANLLLQDDCFVNTQDVLNRENKRFTGAKAKLDSSGWNRLFGYKKYKKGDSILINGVANFQKKESGWVLVSWDKY